MLSDEHASLLAALDVMTLRLSRLRARAEDRCESYELPDGAEFPHAREAFEAGYSAGVVRGLSLAAVLLERATREADVEPVARTETEAA